MYTSRYLLATTKEKPSATKIISHQLMLQAGMIKKLTSGIYTWLPTGLRVLKKLENIIRKEMKKIHAIEIFMPNIQPINLWKKSNRIKEYGSELIKIKDRNNKKFILGPTNEEIITHIFKNNFQSYKTLPIILFQIQNKFRDEIRPRSGIIRTKEFLMKDAYSFHENKKSLKKTYKIFYKTYKKIFSIIGLNIKIIKANTGSIGGKISHEFHVLSKTGENKIIFSNNSKHSSNINSTNYKKKKKLSYKNKPLKIIKTKKIFTIKKLIKKFHFPIKKIIKIIIVHSAKKKINKLIGLIIRADHNLNKDKVEKISIIKKPLTYATYQEIFNITGINPFFLGPINSFFPIIIDYNVSTMKNFISGANINKKFYIGINWNRDLKLPKVFNIRDIISKNKNLNNKNLLKIKKSIEIAHIFQLNNKYSKILNAKTKNQNGILKYIKMGCYGIGMTRVIASAIEQNHDAKGIIWNKNLAPFDVAILPINMFKSIEVKKKSKIIYHKLKKLNIKVLFDDRKKQFGEKFNDIELIGIPHILIISKKNIKKNIIEYKNRKKKNKKIFTIQKIIKYLIKKIIY